MKLRASRMPEQRARVRGAAARVNNHSSDARHNAKAGSCHRRYRILRRRFLPAA